MTDGLLAEDVLSGVECGEGELLVVLAAVLATRDDVDDVDVAPAEPLLVVGLDLGNAELLCPRLRQVAIEVAEHDHVAQWRARESRQMRRAGPPARADDADPQPLAQSPTPPSRGRSTQRRQRYDRSTAFVDYFTRPPCAKLPWFASPPSVICFAKLWTRFA